MRLYKQTFGRSVLAITLGEEGSGEGKRREGEEGGGVHTLWPGQKLRQRGGGGGAKGLAACDSGGSL